MGSQMTLIGFPAEINIQLLVRKSISIGSTDGFFDDVDGFTDDLGRVHRSMVQI